MVLFHTSPYCARHDRACGIRHDRFLDAYEDSGAPRVAGPPFCSTTCDGRALFAACFSCKVRWEDLQVAVGNPQCGAFSPTVAKGERLKTWPLESLVIGSPLESCASLSYLHIFHFEYAHQRRPTNLEPCWRHTYWTGHYWLEASLGASCSMSCCRECPEKWRAKSLHRLSLQTCLGRAKCLCNFCGFS